MKFKIFLFFFVFLLLPTFVNSINVTSTGVFTTVEYAKNATYSYPERIEYFNFNNFHLDFSDINTKQLKYDLTHGVNKDSVLFITKTRGVLSSKLCEDSVRNDGTNTCSFFYDNTTITQDYYYAYVCTPDLDYCSTKTFKLLLRDDSEKIESGVYLKSIDVKDSSYSYPKRVEYFNFDNFTLNFSNIVTRGLKYDVKHHMNVDRNSTLIITKTRSTYSSKLCEDSVRFDGINTCSFTYDDDLIRQDYLYAYLCTDDLDYCTTKTFKFLLRNDSEKIESGVYFKSVNVKNSSYSYPKRVEYFNFENFFLNFSNIITKGVKYDVSHHMNIDKNSSLIITKTRGEYSSKLCEDFLRFDGTNTCSFNYDNTTIAQDYLYAYLCTPDLDYCRTKTFKFLLRDDVEKIETAVFA